MYENIDKYIYFRLFYKGFFRIFLRSNMIFSRVNTTFFYVNRRIVSRSAPKYKRFKLLHKTSQTSSLRCGRSDKFYPQHFSIANTNHGIAKESQVQTQTVQTTAFFRLVQKLYYFQKSKYHSIFGCFLWRCRHF